MRGLRRWAALVGVLWCTVAAAADTPWTGTEDLEPAAAVELVRRLCLPTALVKILV